MVIFNSYVKLPEGMLKVARVFKQKSKAVAKAAKDV
jgi:hypothetical protein